MTSRLTIDVDPDTLDLVLDALRIDAAKRQRAASLAALELQREGPKDRRPGAMLVANTLADAGRLEEFARTLERAIVTTEDAPVATATDPVILATPTTPAALHAELEALRAGENLPPSALDEDLDDEEGVIGASEVPELRTIPVAPA